MEPNEISMLSRISRRRFHSFSEAAEELLDALSESVPGVVALARTDPDEGVHRVIEARGAGVDGLRRGAAVPPAGGGLDRETMRSLGARDWLDAPLELGDGRIVGVLVAAAGRPDALAGEHAAQLGVVAGLLGYEWENVELRSELRRLRGRLNTDPSTDPETGLPDREGFLELLRQEWRLVQRGSVQSVAVVCRVSAGGEAGAAGSTGARDRLTVKLAAETLRATTRDTDRVGRIGDSAVGAVLVGCDPQHTPAFLARFLGAFERVTAGSGPEAEVSCGVQPLADTSSPAEALDLAEAAADEPAPAPVPDLPAQPVE